MKYYPLLAGPSTPSEGRGEGGWLVGGCYWQKQTGEAYTLYEGSVSANPKSRKLGVFNRKLERKLFNIILVF